MSRARQSPARPGAGTSTAATTSMLIHEPPQHPLDANAQRRLQALTQTHQLRNLKTHQNKAAENITNNAYEINEMLYQREELIRKRKAKRQAEEREPDSDDEREEANVEKLREEVGRMTKKMDESIRKIIDGQQSLEHIENSLRSVTTNAASHSTVSQRQTQGMQRRGEDSEASVLGSFDPTDPAAGTAPPPPASSVLFRQRVDREKDTYTNLSLSTRYADHNTYIGFKQHVHEAHNPGEDAPPLPHRNTWFEESGAEPAPGVTAAEDSDDDIAIAREKISTKCPLTLLEFKDPVTSKKCPHSFEKSAIMEMIRQPHGRGRVVKCPVAGCDQMLTADDLSANAALQRKIKRIQASRNAHHSDDEDEGPRSTMNNRPESIASDSGEDIDDVGTSARRSKSVKPKSEPGTQRARGRGLGAIPKSSAAVVDLGEGSDSEEGD
ncbi:hypothetical protein LTS18_003366 [Coniosporium uncinatum]|uniref:Uncharacterized protein n=1 Tax=Coniosporium uncinatum TaxID=93489 RepID=A0ACC3DTH9_9PEZI|nr:hypothetical protein LTS18_003366 [Coniosporium uncinatum]